MSQEGFSFDLTGPGPFELPLLAEFDGLIILKQKDVVLAEFRSEEGKKLYVPISYRAVPALVDALATLPAVHGGALPTSTPPTSGRKH